MAPPKAAPAAGERVDAAGTSLRFNAAGTALGLIASEGAAGDVERRKGIDPPGPA